jgi:hypothetical protein
VARVGFAPWRIISRDLQRLFTEEQEEAEAKQSCSSGCDTTAPLRAGTEAFRSEEVEMLKGVIIVALVVLAFELGLLLYWELTK